MICRIPCRECGVVKSLGPTTREFKEKMMTNKKNGGKYLGSDSFPDGQPVCRPVVPGRRPKPLEGPVHPGFKGKPKIKSPKIPIQPTITRSDQNDDLYKPSRKNGTQKSRKK